MAFIDFSDAAHPALPVANSNVVPIPAARTSDADGGLLSRLERRVVELAREDGLKSLIPQRPRRWLARLIFGPMPPSKMLANEQLEALRQLAVQAWHHGYTLPVSAIREAQAAGHSEAKVGAVIDFIGRLRAPVRRLAA
jgi:hypothetical protein